MTRAQRTFSGYILGDFEARRNAVARLFRGEGFPPVAQKSPASEDAGYSTDRPGQAGA
jgi:hypothetical protein